MDAVPRDARLTPLTHELNTLTLAGTSRSGSMVEGHGSNPSLMLPQTPTSPPMAIGHNPFGTAPGNCSSLVIFQEEIATLWDIHRQFLGQLKFLCLGDKEPWLDALKAGIKQISEEASSMPELVDLCSEFLKQVEGVPNLLGSFFPCLVEIKARFSQGALGEKVENNDKTRTSFGEFATLCRSARESLITDLEDVELLPPLAILSRRASRIKCVEVEGVESPVVQFRALLKSWKALLNVDEGKFGVGLEVMQEIAMTIAATTETITTDENTRRIKMLERIESTWKKAAELA